MRYMKKSSLIASSLLIFLLSQISVSANLVQVYRQAMTSDPTYHNSIASFMDNRELLPQSIAANLLTAVLQLNDTHTRVTPRHLMPGTFSQSFNSHGYDLSLSQPIFNWANWKGIAVAKNAVKASYANLLFAKQDLMLRVARAYFNVLQAQDNLRFILAEKRFNEQQLEQTQQRFKVGLDAITSVYDSRAGYDSVVAQVIAARNDLKNSREALREITGVLYTHLAPLSHQIPLRSPQPARESAWVQNAEQYNYQILSARYTALSQKENIQVQFAGHLPTLTATGTVSYLNSHSPTVEFTGQGNRTEQGQLLLNIPIYQGGAITSLTRQARYQYLEAVTNMEITHRSVVSQTRQTYNSIISGISQIQADKQAIVSRRASLKGQQAAFKVGTRTIVDVLNAQQALTQSQQEYSRDQYDFINNILLLKADSGRLCESDLAIINSWLNQHYISVKTAHSSYHQLAGKSELDATQNNLEEHQKNLEKEKAKKVNDHNEKNDTKKTGVQNNVDSGNANLEDVHSTTDTETSNTTTTDNNENTTNSNDNTNTNDDKDNSQNNNSVNHNDQTSHNKKIEKKEHYVTAHNHSLTREAKRYTIQLLATPVEHDARIFIKSHHLSQKATYYPVTRHNKNLYEVIYGEFNSARQANKVLKSLNPTLLKNKPWVRSINNVSPSIAHNKKS